MKTKNKLIILGTVLFISVVCAVYSFINYTTPNFIKALYAKSYIQDNSAYYMGDSKYMVLRKSKIDDTYVKFVEAVDGEGLKKTTDGVTDFYVYNDNNGDQKKIEALVDTSTPGSGMIIKIVDR